MNTKFKSSLRGACHFIRRPIWAVVILLLAATMNAQTQYNYTIHNYTILSVPGATETFAEGIDSNHIVGYYVDGSGDSHGFYTTAAITSF